jgi:hypothetical protein
MSSETKFERPGAPFDEALKRAVNTPPTSKKSSPAKSKPKDKVA